MPLAEKEPPVTLGQLAGQLDAREAHLLAEIDAVRNAKAQFVIALTQNALATGDQDVLSAAGDVGVRVIAGLPIAEGFYGHDQAANQPVGKLFETIFDGDLTHLMPLAPGQAVQINHRLAASPERFPPDNFPDFRNFLTTHSAVKKMIDDANIWETTDSEAEVEYFPLSKLKALIIRLDGKPVNDPAITQVLLSTWALYCEQYTIPRVRSKHKGKTMLIPSSEVPRFLLQLNGKLAKNQTYAFTIEAPPGSVEVKKNL